MPSKQLTYRSARTGEYVTEQYAKRHPVTTVKETNIKTTSTRKS